MIQKCVIAVLLACLWSNLALGAVVRRNDGSRVAGNLHVTQGQLAVEVSPNQTELIPLPEVAEILTLPPRAPAPTAAIEKSGLKGEYFSGTEFKNRKVLRADAQLQFNWDAPGENPLLAPGQSWGQICIRWTGLLIPRYTERYTLISRWGGRAKIWIDDKLVIDGGDGCQIDLQAGHSYRLRIEQIPDPNGKSFFLQWVSPHQLREIIPQDCFRYPPDDPDLPTAIDLSTPEDNRFIWNPTDITITPQILQRGKDPIQAVEYYANDQQLARVDGPPHPFIWRHPPPGDYQVWAKVVTSVGISRTPGSRRVVVRDAKSPLPKPWSASVVGTLPDGRVSESHGLWSIVAKGGNVGGPMDNFHAVLQPMAGDVECLAHIAKLDAGDHGFAGIVLCDGLSGNLPAVGIGVNATGRTVWFCREHGWQENQQTEMGTTAPRYFRLVRHERAVRIFASDDSHIWSAVAEVQVDLPPTAWGGIFASGETGDHEVSAEFDALVMRTVERFDFPSPAVALIDGSILEGHLVRVDGPNVVIERGLPGVDKQSLTLELSNVAAILYDPCDDALFKSLPSDPHGVVMVSGDFCEGDITSMAPEGVDVSSIAFGISHYLAGTDIKATVLRSPHPAPARFELALTDGTVLRILQIRAAGDNLEVDTATVHGVKVAPTAILRLTPCPAPSVSASPSTSSSPPDHQIISHQP